MSVINFIIAVFGLVAGAYFYWQGPALYSFLGAAVIFYIVLASSPLLVSIVASFILVQALYYQKPESTQEKDSPFLLKDSRQS